MGDVKLGVYCETLGPEILGDRSVLDLLGAFGVTLGHALRFTLDGVVFDPDSLAPALELGCAVREAGGGYALWPLLPKSMGYWINERNLDAVDRMADAVLQGCERFGARPDLVVADVETPWQQMERVYFPGPPAWRKAASAVRLAIENRSPRRYARAAARLSKIVSRLREHAAPVSAAVFPLLIADLAIGGNALQDYMEMPIFPVPFDAYNAMFYNSYLPEAVPWMIPAQAAPRALYEYATVLAGRFGDGAWVTLGSTWEGVLPGNEGKAYTEARMLAPDAAAARAAGIDTLWLYCLEGVLFSDQKLSRRRSPEQAAAFFEVMRETPAQEPEPSRKWSRGRALPEIVAKDRLASRYRWEEAGLSVESADATGPKT